MPSVGNSTPRPALASRTATTRAPSPPPASRSLPPGPSAPPARAAPPSAAPEHLWVIPLQQPEELVRHGQNGPGNGAEPRCHRGLPEEEKTVADGQREMLIEFPIFVGPAQLLGPT